MIGKFVTKKLLVEAGELVLKMEAELDRRMEDKINYTPYEDRLETLTDTAKKRYKRRLDKMIAQVKEAEEHGVFEYHAKLDREQHLRKLASEAYKLWRKILDLKHDYIMEDERGNLAFHRIMRIETRAYRRWNRRIIKLPDSEVKSMIRIKEIEG